MLAPCCTSATEVVMEDAGQPPQRHSGLVTVAMAINIRTTDAEEESAAEVNNNNTSCCRGDDPAAIQQEQKPVFLQLHRTWFCLLVPAAAALRHFKAPVVQNEAEIFNEESCWSGFRTQRGTSCSTATVEPSQRPHTHTHTHQCVKDVHVCLHLTHRNSLI